MKDSTHGYQNSSGILLPGPHEFLARQRKKLGTRLPLILMVIAALLFITCITTIFSYQEHRQEAAISFDEAIIPISARLEKRMNGYAGLVTATKALFAASEEVHRKEFHDFVAKIGNNVDSSAVKGLTFIRRVRKKETDPYIRSVRNDKSLISIGYPSFKIFPDSDTDEHYVITFAEPSTDHEHTLGYDFTSNPEQLALFNQIRDTGNLLITGAVALPTDLLKKPFSQQNPAPDSMAYIAAVYENGMPLGTISERRTAHLGFISVGVSIAKMADDIFNNFILSNGIMIELLRHEPEYNRIVPVKSFPVLESGLMAESELTKDSIFRAGDRSWTVRFTALPSSPFFQQTWQVPFLIFIVGLAFTSVVGYLLLSALFNTKKLLSLFEEKIIDLEDTNILLHEIFDSVPTPMFLKQGTDLKVKLWNKEMERMTGISRHEILDLVGLESFPSQELDGYLKIDQKALARGKRIAVQETLTTKYGDKKLIYTIKTPIRCARSNKVFLLGISEELGVPKGLRQREIGSISDSDSDTEIV